MNLTHRPWHVKPEASGGPSIVERMRRPADDEILLGDNLPLLRGLADETFQLVYVDPPFNTGRTQKRVVLETTRDPGGDRVGFGGRTYASRLLAESSYRDSFDDYLGFLAPRLAEARLLTRSGTLYLHVDHREAHYRKLLLDELFGRECFLNEIVWAYDYGARATRRWPAKHDTILVYVKDARDYWFDSAEVDREPYMAPGLVTAEKAARASCRPTSGGTRSCRRAGTRRRATRRRSRRGSCAGWCSRRPGRAMVPRLFAGSGTLGAVAAGHGRRYVLIDSNPEAVRVMERRLAPLRCRSA